MNICMFTNTYLPHVGGVARSVHVFVKDLRHLGHRVLVVAPEFDEPIPEERDTLRLPAIQEFNGSDFSVRIPLPYMVEREIEAFKPDIIHSHHPFLLGDTALRVARRKFLPLVFTHHTLYERYTHYVPLESDRLESFLMNLATLYANLCDGVIAPSRSIADLIQSRGVRVPIEEIPTGVDLAFFAKGDGSRFRRAFGIAPDALVVGHLGRLAPEKNLVFLADAMTGFMQRRPEAVFLVIGDGPSGIEISQKFRKMDMGHRVILAGQQTGQALADGYAAMDLFVFASFSETQGMVLAEAMASGVPVIALEASGVRDVLADGRNGRMLPETAGPEDFAAAVDAAADNPEQMRQWKTESLLTARSQSREVCAGRLVDFYHDRITAKSVNDKKHKKGDLNALDALSERIKVEWELLSTKVKSAVDATASKDTDPHRGRRAQSA